MNPGPPRRWHRRSLRLRVIAAILVWVVLGIGGIGLSATRLFTRHVEQQFHDELDVHVRELAGLVQVAPRGGAEMNRPLSDPRYLEPDSGFYWQVHLDRGETLRSPSLKGRNLDLGVAGSGAIRNRMTSGPTGPAITYGFARATGDGRQVHFVIATDQRLLDQATGRFTRELLAWLVGMALALVATGYALVTFGLAPLDRLRQALARLRSGKDGRLEGRFPSEIAPLADDLNAFIAHNAATLERARIEAGNLAHALRTPLAVVTDEAEHLAANPATAASGQVLLEQARQMAQQLEYRLARARTVASAGMPGTASDVAAVLQPVVRAMRRLHPHIAIAVRNDCPGDCSLPVDPIDLSELLSILLDNACKWASTEVAVTVSSGPAGPEVRIRDDGPGLPAEQIAAAFEIGARFDPAKPGTGLGLAIARDIANWYALDVKLAAGRDGRGLTATIATRAAG